MSSPVNHLGLLLVSIVLIGSGCLQPVASTRDDEKAAQALSFSSGDQFVFRETVFGLGGKVVDLLGGVSAERTVTIKSFDLTGSIEADWSLITEQETEASRQAQEAYNAQYTNAPIGTKIPERPDLIKETVTETGTLQASDVGSADHLQLPTFWTKGEQVLQKNSLIWLTKEQYQELVQTRKTKINLGLFDNSIAFAQSLSDQAKQITNWITQSKQLEENKDVLLVEANQNWGTYSLLIQGQQKTVRTIQAQNAFARYTILANENNPLILEVVLSPLSRGSFDVFHKEGLREAFMGYEVTSITQSESSNADPLQP